MYKRILVAIDDSSCSMKTLDEAINLSKALGAALCVAHAADEGTLTHLGIGLENHLDIEKTKREIASASNALLDAAVAKAAAAGCAAEKRHVESSRRRIAEMIADVAREWQADLVVVGTHGRRGFEAMLVGSVAENLVRIAPTSLMLVREA